MRASRRLREDAQGVVSVARLPLTGDDAQRRRRLASEHATPAHEPLLTRDRLRQVQMQAGVAVRPTPSQRASASTGALTADTRPSGSSRFHPTRTSSTTTGSGGGRASVERAEHRSDLPARPTSTGPVGLAPVTHRGQVQGEQHVDRGHGPGLRSPRPPRPLWRTGPRGPPARCWHRPPGALDSRRPDPVTEGTEG